MAGYTRQDTANNIANGNVIDADDFDAEYNAIEGAFNSTSGHTHDGTAGEGAPITKVGPAQDLIVSSTAVLPKTTNTLDLGSASVKYKDAYLSGTTSTEFLTVENDAEVIDSLTVGGTTTLASTLNVTGAATLSDTLSVTGTVTASAGITGTLTGNVIGNVTGNVTGNLTGNVTGDVTGNITGNVTGNATTATSWQTPRTLSLTGDVTGTATGVDGSGNISIATTVAPNSVALGADTTGNYVASLVAGTGVTLTNNTGEGATPTVAIGQAVGTTSNVTFNDVVVSGNLTVSGTTTTVNTETVNIADNQIVLNSNYTGSTPTENGGIEIERGTLANKTLVWDETADKWTVGSETFVAGTFEGNLTGAVTGNASTASTLQTARTIALGGDVTGSASFNGGSNVTITATVADDSHNHVISNVDGLQTALDAKAPLASPTFTGTATIPVVSFAAGGWSIDQVGTELHFLYNGVVQFKMLSTGTFEASNDVAAEAF